MLSLFTPDVNITHMMACSVLYSVLEAKAAIYNQLSGLKGVADLLITNLSTGCKFSVLLM